MRHLRYFLFIQLTILLALALPLILIGLMEDRRMGAGVVAAWVIVLYSSIRLGLLAANGAKRLISLTFWIFVYVWLGVSPMLQALSNSFPLPGSYSTARVVVSLGVVFAGLVAFDVGQALSRSGEGRWSSLYHALLRRELVASRAVMIGVIGGVLALVLISRLGGADILFESRGDMEAQVFGSAGGEGKAHFLLFMVALRTPLFIAVYLLVVAYAAGWRSARYAIPMLILGLSSLIINNPVNSPRYWLGLTVFSVLFVVVPWNKNFSFSLYATILALLLLFVFPYSDLFRISKEVVAPDLSGVAPLVEKGDYDAFQQLMNTVDYVSDHGITRGRQIAGTLLFWVPRGLWTSKPLPSGTLIGKELGYSFLNISLPLWGEAYLDGGIVAVVLVFLCYGVLAGRLEWFYCDPRWSATNFVTLLVPIYAAYQIFMLRGTLMSTLAYFVPVLLLLLACTKPSSGNTVEDRATSPAPS